MSAIEKEKVVSDLVVKTYKENRNLSTVFNQTELEQELAFCLAIIKKNPYTLQKCFENRDEMMMAIKAQLAMGLSFNPVMGHVSIIIRKGKPCIDVGYKGMAFLGYKMGLLYIVTNIVYEKDNFEFRGMGKEPLHEFNPFDSDRGAVVGAYCVAKLPSGEFYIVTMPINEIWKIRDRSVSWKAAQKDPSKTSPWVTDEGEMIKKTVIRRAYKSWPIVKSETSPLEKALEINDEDTDLESGPVVEVDVTASGGMLENIRGQLNFLDRSEEKAIQFFETLFSRKIEKLEDLTPLEAEKAQAMLQTWVDNKLAKGDENEPS